MYFFFFQAEDGIRDFHVTGVQTCALPISGCPTDTGLVTDPASRSSMCGGEPAHRRPDTTRDRRRPRVPARAPAFVVLGVHLEQCSSAGVYVGWLVIPRHLRRNGQQRPSFDVPLVEEPLGAKWTRPTGDGVTAVW